MGKIDFNYKSTRSEKARLAVKLSRKWPVILSGLMIVLLFLGVDLIVIEVAAGWALIGLAAIPAMIVEWYNGELKNLLVTSNPQNVDDVLSADVLGHLSAQPSPKEVALIVGNIQGGQFFATRFGIGTSFLQSLTSESDTDMSVVWQEAWNIYEATGSENISAVILMVALLKNVKNYQTLLGHLQLDADDLVHGVEWYNHLMNIINGHKRPRRTGGVARDWSFGWTPLLSRFGVNISQQINGSDNFLIKLASHGESIDQLTEIFGKKGRQNAVLVGPTGVGKTEIIHAFASKLMDASASIPASLKFRQIFILDASSMIASAAGRGELEQLVPKILFEAYHAKNIIICLDNAQLFFEDGIGSIDISNVLLPILQAGNLRMILTMDEQQYLKLSNRNPEIINSLNRISVAPANRSETIAIMQDHTIMIEFQNHVTYMYQALAEAYRLGDRYVHELAMPGKALKLLESSAHYSESNVVTAKSVQQAIEKTLDIKVGTATGDEEREKLLNLENLIHTRMINQSRAVQVVSDALRRARAGVRNQNRPIGTFMFLGPTGVGKTELAKALAAIYFDGEDRIIRLDMNEYSSSNDVSRLIADGADDANSLTARAMKQPFSVVLLDEIEKAHPNVLSTLLQMLDEGILRDVKNREVSFRDAIIIATSNAGADRIREYIDRGYDIEKFEDQFVDQLISSNQFRPEFLNRFDEIVIFRPLKKEELLQVVDLMIADVNKTLALQKISVKVSDDAKKYLVDAGYDPRLGARPMRRVVQRAVENTVAKQMLSGKVDPGSTIEISLEQVQQIISSKNEADKIIEDQKQA
jgi:ATP-dependent Clp protease ATP-binding subunit ClpC